MSTRLLSMHEVTDRCGLSRVHVYRLIRNDQFPRPVQVAPRRVAFVESEVEAWIDKRVAERESPDYLEHRRRLSEESSKRVAAAHRRGCYGGEG